MKWESDMPGAEPRERLTLTGAVRLLLIVGAAVFLIAYFSPPNLKITKQDPVTRTMTER